MSAASEEIPPPSWQHDGVEYRLAEDGPESWRVTRGGAPLGILLLLHADEERAWSLRDENNPVLGVGVSWPTWQEALVELVEHRQREDVARP
jgi:hypothetical protein